MDAAVSYAVLGRAWSLFSAPLTIYLIGARLTSIERGFFYTFGAVAALQIFLDLGFSLSIVQFTSHEFARLRLLPSGVLAGDADARSRLVSVGRLAVKYYFIMALVFFAVVGCAGQWFFASAPDAARVEWVVPWWSLCFFASCNLAFMPFYSLLEGCNEVGFVNGCRTAAAFAYGLCLWAALWGGMRLFAAALSSAGLFLAPLAIVVWRWRRFFRVFQSQPPGPVVSWRNEIWPFQWKLGCSAVSGYLTFQLFNPVILQLKGAAEAGRMGMTLQVVNALTNVCYSWVGTKSPRFGMLIQTKRFPELDRLFRRSLAQSLLVCLAGSGAVLLALALLRSHTSWGGKFLGYDAFCFLIAAGLITQVLFAQAAYLRAHKQEPFLFLSIVNALLTTFAVLVGAVSHGSVGACAGYALVQLLLLPFATAVFARCRRLWHSSPSNPP